MQAWKSSRRLKEMNWRREQQHKRGKSKGKTEESSVRGPGRWSK